MSNEHLDAIREAMENTWTGDDEGYVVVMAHAEALAAQVKRLQGWALVLEVKFGEESGLSDAEVESMRQFYLHPGDLPDEEV